MTILKRITVALLNYRILTSKEIDKIAQNYWAKFWGLVEIKQKDECWPWLGKLSAGGYGSFSAQIVANGFPAHRLAFMLFFPNELSLEKPVACHHCDSRSCCNPYHMYAGDLIDNANDRLAAEKTRKILEELDDTIVKI